MTGTRRDKVDPELRARQAARLSAEAGANGWQNSPDLDAATESGGGLQGGGDAASSPDPDGDPWADLFDTQALRCCDCPACNHYLPHDKAKADRLGVPVYDPTATCVVVAAVERIVADRLRAVEAERAICESTSQRNAHLHMQAEADLAAERAKHEALREKLAALADEWEHAGFEIEPDQLRAALLDAEAGASDE